MAAQPSNHFTISEQITNTLTPFYPSWQPSSYLNLPPFNKLPPHSYIFLSLWQLNSYLILPHLNKYPLVIAPFYHPHWQPNSYIILPALKKILPPSYTMLAPFAAQLLHHFSPSEQTTRSLLDHFVPYGSSTFESFYHF